MSERPLSHEEVAHRGFGTTFRGFDTAEVRAYLKRVAEELHEATSRERDLLKKVADAEHRAAHPVIEGEALNRALGEEMGRILAAAQEAANRLKEKAEENAARILREAHEQAHSVNGQAEAVLSVRTEEADAVAAEIRQAAEAEGAALVERANREATLTMADIEDKARQLVNDAQAARTRVLGDLTRRRRLLQSQVEQLRAGRELLLDAYRTVRSTTDDVVNALQRVEDEARDAASAVGAAAAAQPPTDALDAAEIMAELAAPREELGPAPASDIADVVDVMEVVEVVDPVAIVAEPGPDVAEPVSLSEAVTEADDPEMQPTEVHRTETHPSIPAPETPNHIVTTRPGAAGTRSLRLLPQPEPPVPAEPPVPPGPAVDELFARIRADRASAVARAHEVLAAPPEPAPPSSTPTHRTIPAPAPTAAAAAATTEPTGPAEAEALLERRDSAVEGIDTRLARKLKRALQDEQNEVLDQLRSAKPGVTADAVLPALDTQAGRYRQAAEELLRTAAVAGLVFATPGGAADIIDTTDELDVSDVVTELAMALAEPLRRNLERSFEDQSDGDDPGVIVERIGAAYRGCKAQRIEGLAGDAVTSAFGRGALAALPPGSSSQWVVDDDGRPCPDCDDNALAGSTRAGEEFPTGQRHPPAHTGCRCLIVLAAVPATARSQG